MKLYRTLGTTVWYGTQADAKLGTKQFGRGFEQVDVPTDKEGLLHWLNSNTVIPGVAGVDNCQQDEVDELHQAEQRAIAAAQPPSGIVDARPVNTNWDVTSIEEFILERASVAQCEQIFARLGTRFKELANEGV